MEKSYVVGIKTNEVGLIEQFEVDCFNPVVGDPVIVTSSENEEAFGIVSTPKRSAVDNKQKLRKVIRKASKIDTER
ncbi:MAG: hypothetical protein HQK84_09280, partial [Nitrospinae bacterium]|nr:hypothetical protein [Nitrospinota bacterium]